MSRTFHFEAYPRTKRFSTKRSGPKKKIVKIEEHFTSRYIHSQKGAIKRSDAIKKNMQKFKNI